MAKSLLNQSDDESVKILHCPSCEQDKEPQNKSINAGPDAINTEFLYYSATIREIAPKLTSEIDRQLIIPWIRRLFRPEYHSSMLRVKRNQYLLHLTLTIMNDEANGIFKELPPTGSLRFYENLPLEETYPKAEWELDTMWTDVLHGLPDGKRNMTCSVHDSFDQCMHDRDLDKILDEEFSYFLYLARPYAVLLRSPEDRAKAACWLQTLCTIQANSCSSMKRIRNDYIMSLLGYMSDLKVAGPFMELPQWDPLLPLEDTARILAQSPPVMDPCSSEANEFLSIQPVPDEGAFCYIAVTGDVLDSSLNEID